MADKKNNEPAKKVVPRGKAIRWTDDDIDEYCSAKNMQRMAEHAAEDWKKNAPRGFKKMLDAEKE